MQASQIHGCLLSTFQLKKLNKYQLKMNKKGFTLIELIVVLFVLAILAAIVVPLFNGYIDRACYKICEANRSRMEKLYHICLGEDENQETNFLDFQRKYGRVCPKKGEILYIGGKVICLLHYDGDDEGGGEEKDVPYL